MYRHSVKIYMSCFFCQQAWTSIKIIHSGNISFFLTRCWCQNTMKLSDGVEKRWWMNFMFMLYWFDEERRKYQLLICTWENEKDDQINWCIFAVSWYELFGRFCAWGCGNERAFGGTVWFYVWKLKVTNHGSWVCGHFFDRNVWGNVHSRQLYSGDGA